MNTTNPYLNPVELLDLADRPNLSAADIRKAKKRFLTEMELDGREDFHFHGQLFTRNDLDRVSQEVENDGILVAYAAAAKAKGLSAFLTSGQTEPEFDHQQLFDPRLAPVLKNYFGPAYNQAFGRAVAARNLRAVRTMTGWRPEAAGVAPSELYHDAYRGLNARVDDLITTVEAYLTDPRSPAGRELKGMKAFADNFPQALIAALPPYFGDLTNKLAERLTPYIIRLNNERNNPRMALALTKSILRLEHLSDERREELKKIGRTLRDNVGAVNRSQEAASNSESSSSYVWLIVVVVMMLFRIGACVASSNKSSRSSRPSYRSQRPYVPPPPRVRQPADYQREYAIDLREAVRNGRPPSSVIPDQRANIPIGDLAPVFLPDAGVREVNQVMQNLREDTVYHILGHVMYRPTLPFEPDELFEKLTERAIVPADRDTSKLYRTLVELNEDIKIKEGLKNAALRAERLEREKREEQRTAEKNADAAARKANRLAEKRANERALAKLGRDAFVREPKDDILGPKARMPENYSILLKSTISNRERLIKHGPIKKIKVGIDDPEMSAVVVWRDTLGLRQVRVSATRSIPLVFKVASGKINKLLEGYVVYGKRWSDQETSPWGGKGWYKEVLCYCGPDDHKAFINGKRKEQKNLWLPSKKIDKGKSMSAGAWLRGVKRLR